MKSVLIIYAISWLILGSVFIASKVTKQNQRSYDKESWYLYALIIGLAPLVVVFVIPYVLFDDWKDKKRKKLLKKEEKENEDRKIAVIKNYQQALEKSATAPMDSFAKVAHEFQSCLEQKQYDEILNVLSGILLPDNCSLEVG